MSQTFRFSLVAVLAFQQIASACSICDPAFQKRFTLRQELAQSSLVVLGNLTDPRLIGENGQTDVRIRTVVKSPAQFKAPVLLTIPRYLPSDPKKPLPCLAFGETDGLKTDLYRVMPLRGDGMAEYLTAVAKLPEHDPSKRLLFYFTHLDRADPDVAADAFLEFAKATDAEVAEVASKLDAARLRKLLMNPETPEDRLNLYAFLLGACGNRDDIRTIRTLLDKPSARFNSAVGGLCGAWIQLEPAAAWAWIGGKLADPEVSFSERLNLLATVRFFRAWKPEAHKGEILKAMSGLIRDGNMADLAIEDLRRWQWWDLTEVILAQYGRKTHAAPIVRKAIVRYAFCCPRKDSLDFADSVRRAEPTTAEEVQEGVDLERAESRPAPPPPVIPVKR